MDIYEEHLRMWLFEEQRPVSYSYLGFEISVSSNTAKQCVLFFLHICSMSPRQCPHAKRKYLPLPTPFLFILHQNVVEICNRSPHRS